LAFLAFLIVFAGTARPLPHISKPRGPAHHPPSQQLLIASDLHFNPFADPALAPSLARAPVRKWEAILNRSSSTAYSPYGQDTNWWLLQSTLDAMRKAEPDPALVVITGDVLAHGFPQKYAQAISDTNRDHYSAFVSKTVSFLAFELRKRFAKPQILLTPGNSDNDCSDYSIEAGEAFLNDTAWSVRGLAKANPRIMGEWKSLGSYTLQPRRIHGLRIISMNSVFFSNKYQPQSFRDGCEAAQSDGPARTYSWLESTLSRAAQDHEKVWIIMHIPPGIDGYSTMVQYRSLSQAGSSTPADVCSQAIVPMWKPFWTELFDRLIAQYTTTITAIFAGHEHMDDFLVIHAGQAEQQFVLIDPPVSPIYGQNPGFRIVTFAAGGSLTDQTTWYLTNLEAAHSTNPGTWTPEYTFTSEWHSPRLDAASLNSIYDQIRSNPESGQRWLTLLNVSSTHQPVPAGGVSALECAITALDPASYKACYCPAH
jgi:sphingomyelin phosphodiesterase acid-like 3